MPRTFSDEEMQKINNSIDVLIQATWDGDWNFSHGEPKEAVEFLKSVDLARWFPEATPAGTAKALRCQRCGADVTNMETDHRLFRCTGGSGSMTEPNERQRCHKCKGDFGLADGGFLYELDEHGDRVFVCESCEPNMAPRE